MVGLGLGSGLGLGARVRVPTRSSYHDLRATTPMWESPSGSVGYSAEATRLLLCTAAAPPARNVAAVTSAGASSSSIMTAVLALIATVGARSGGERHRTLSHEGAATRAPRTWLDARRHQPSQMRSGPPAHAPPESLQRSLWQSLRREGGRRSYGAGDAGAFCAVSLQMSTSLPAPRHTLAPQSCCESRGWRAARVFQNPRGVLELYGHNQNLN